MVSRIGNMPIDVLDGVKVQIDGNLIKISGPRSEEHTSELQSH